MSVATQQDQISMFNHRVVTQPPSARASKEQFFNGMRRFAGAVNVITTRLDGVPYGLTATAVCSLSADPPRLLVCINMAGQTFQAIRARGAFAVNSLAVGQETVARQFAGMGDRDIDRFSIGDWEDGEGLNMPTLMDACCTFECSISEIIDTGSHAMLIADIVEVGNPFKGAPLIYYDGTFCGLLRL